MYQDWDFSLKKKKSERKNFPLRTTKPEGNVGVWDYSELVRTERRYIKSQKEVKSSKLLSGRRTNKIEIKAKIF